MNWKHIVQMHKEIRSVKVGSRGELYVNGDCVSIYKHKKVAEAVADKVRQFIGVK